MRVSVSDAKAQLTELVKRAERGEEITLTRRGKDVVTLKPTAASFDPEARRELMRRIAEQGRAKVRAGPDAARAADFLYDTETGLPD
ncbi:type II toxin-antitoxin system Phd/YefM family antitoxin [Phenylobacterium kunshanense]|uniref:Antitoxin n=1 Tax=Phenylobacterium kunshanense TaxID=1445034 RepID=A0A328B875_9CAUL|nr:type II toxin-antitoxin system prevent-host-death family antitoxin [Phenylobacterium kunshanense]RAK63343.1 type II toxin-antitoxin system prevent-host-death family antitoxin [Phenylobacterium kunshanense]